MSICGHEQGQPCSHAPLGDLRVPRRGLLRLSLSRKLLAELVGQPDDFVAGAFLGVCVYAVGSRSCANRLKLA